MHTKGKWIQEKNPREDTIDIGVRRDRVFCVICSVPWYGEDDVGSEEAESNANILTASLGLLDTIRNARTSLAIMSMPQMDSNVASNSEILKVMADSFKAAIDEAEKA